MKLIFSYYSQQFDRSKQRKSLRDFKRLVCEELKDKVNPDELYRVCV